MGFTMPPTANFKFPNLQFEEKFSGLIAGVDEAGVAPLAGPVVAGAVILNCKNIPQGINDSKKLTAPVREKLFAEITETVLNIGVGIATVEEIDAMNIFHATRKAMLRAVENLGTVPNHVLMDGHLPPKFPCPATAIVGGDALSLSIAAASIIAKVTRDRIMAALHGEFPVYGWLKNKGYPTAEHRSAVKIHGITIHHRRGFAPIKEIYEQQQLEFA